MHTDYIITVRVAAGNTLCYMYVLVTAENLPAVIRVRNWRCPLLTYLV